MNSSIFVVLVVALFAVVAQANKLPQEKIDAIRAKLIPHLNECGKEYDITIEYLKEFKAQKKRPDETNACFFACIFKKVKLMDEQGLFSEANAVEIAERWVEGQDLENAKTAAKACTKVNTASVSDGEKGCDRAKLIYDCIIEQKEQFGVAL